MNRAVTPAMAVAAPVVMSKEALLSWDEVRLMTRDMFDAATQGDWDTVVKIENRRQPRLRALLDQPATQEQASEIARNVEEVLDSDQQIMRMGRERMNALGQQLERMHNGRRAASEYQDQSARQPALQSNPGE